MAASLIDILAGGETFSIARDHLLKFPDCYFAAHLRQHSDESTIEVDRNPAYLGIILDWLRTGELIIVPPSISKRAIFLEAQYYGLDQQMFPEGEAAVRRLRLRWQNETVLDSTNPAVGPICLANKKGSSCQIKLDRISANKSSKKHHIEITTDAYAPIVRINIDTLNGTKLRVDPGPWYVYLKRGTIGKPVAEPITDERVRLTVTHTIPCDEDEIDHVVSSS